MKFFLTLSLIAIYTLLPCHAADPSIVVCTDCDQREIVIIHQMLSSVADHMKITARLIGQYTKSMPMQQVLEVNVGLDAVAYSKLHFRQLEESIKRSIQNGLPKVDPKSFQENTLHISCAQKDEASEPFIEEIPNVKNAEKLLVTAGLFTSDTPVSAITNEVLLYQKAIKGPDNDFFFEFPMPTNPITTMMHVLLTSKSLKGKNALIHLPKEESAPLVEMASHFLDILDKYKYAKVAALVPFLAFADPELFQIGVWGGRGLMTKAIVAQLRTQLHDKEKEKAAKKNAAKTPQPSSSSSNVPPFSPPPHGSSSVRKKTAKTKADKDKVAEQAVLAAKKEALREKAAKKNAAKTHQRSSSSSNVPPPSPPNHGPSSSHVKRRSQKARF